MPSLPPRRHRWACHSPVEVVPSSPKLDCQPTFKHSPSSSCLLPQNLSANSSIELSCICDSKLVFSHDRRCFEACVDWLNIHDDVQIIIDVGDDGTRFLFCLVLGFHIRDYESTTGTRSRCKSMAVAVDIPTYHRQVRSNRRINELSLQCHRAVVLRWHIPGYHQSIRLHSGHGIYSSESTIRRGIPFDRTLN